MKHAGLERLCGLQDTDMSLATVYAMTIIICFPDSHRECGFTAQLCSIVGSKQRLLQSYKRQQECCSVLSIVANYWNGLDTQNHFHLRGFSHIGCNLRWVDLPDIKSSSKHNHTLASGCHGSTRSPWWISAIIRNLRSKNSSTQVSWRTPKTFRASEEHTRYQEGSTTRKSALYHKTYRCKAPPILAGHVEEVDFTFKRTFNLQRHILTS